MADRAISAAARWAVAVLVLTSLHHVYGAVIYATPWRYHAVLVSGAVAALIVGCLAMQRAWPDGLPGRLARLLLALTIVVFPVLVIGAFEGGYNHIVKNVLYFGGASAEVMTRLFPPPRYEMPNDLLFEITGLLQVVPAAVAGWHIVRATKRPSEGRTAADDLARFRQRRSPIPGRR